MKTLYVNTLSQPGLGEFDEVFLVSKSENKENNRKQPYVSLVLQDKTGEVDAKFWDCADRIPVGSFIKIRASYGEYRDAPQLRVVKWRDVPESEVNIEDFFRVSRFDRDGMYNLVLSHASDIKNETLRELTTVLVQQYSKELRDAPAAMVRHQPYLGGLLEHILNLIILSGAICRSYDPTNYLDLDLLISASILHDLGKVFELTYSRAIGYTRQGSLIGHVAIVLQMIAQQHVNGDERALEHLMHIIVSHHGRREWGTMVEPMSREAMVFHQLDMIDSQMGNMDELLRSCPATPDNEIRYYKGAHYYFPATPEKEG